MVRLYSGLWSGGLLMLEVHKKPVATQAKMRSVVPHVRS
jgi:hypothetical protein